MPPKQNKPLEYPRWGRVLARVWELVAATATATNGKLIQMMESQVRTLFFEVRGPVVPPDNIVILTIDEQSLSIPQQYYQTNPQQYPGLKRLQASSWQRLACVRVIDKLMKAGVRHVALDIVFATPSSYGSTGDRKFAQILQRYANLVTLTAPYEQPNLRQGNVVQLTLPDRQSWIKPMSVGFANFPLDLDGRVHRFASEFPLSLATKYK